MSLVAIAFAGALSLSADKWEIKPDVAPKSSYSYSMDINAHVGGENHEAEFRLVRDVTATDKKGTSVKFTWADLVVDEHAAGEDNVFETTLDARGAIVATTSHFGESARRMLSVMQFIYPEGPIAIKDQWALEVKPEGLTVQKISVEALAIEKIGEHEVMKFSVKLDEPTPEGIHSDGTFWVEKSGKVARFALKVKNWVVPMAGEETAEAEIRGELLPGK